MDSGKTRVFLIEDNPGDARLIQDLLAEAGDSLFDLGHADCLSTGLKRLAKGDIDVLLLDLSLPDSQGLDSLSKVIAKVPKVPILVMSGLEDELVAMKAVQEGAQDYVVKGSVDAKLLARSLRYAIERQHLRVALRESESRYRLLADNAADVIWTANMKWRITYVSPSVKRLLGYTVEEIKRLAIVDILTLDSLRQARKLIRNQMDIMTPWSQYPPLSLTLEYVRKDGSTLWAEVILSFLWDEDGKLSEVLGVTRDITERKKAEESLRRSEGYFRALMENSPDAVIVINEDGTVRYESPSYQGLLGFKREDRLGNNLFERIHPDDIARVAELFAEFLQNRGGTLRAEVRAKHRDGSWRFIDAIGSNLLDNPVVKGIVVNYRDITERKKAEKALTESEERYRLVVENANEAILVAQDGMLRFFNTRVIEILGYSREELSSKPFTEFIHPGDQAMVVGRYIARLEGKEVPPVYSFRVVDKTGNVRWMEISAVMINWEGRPATLNFLTDITERRKAEEEKRRMEEQLLLAGRLAAVGELSAGVAHELNNPLAAIQGFAELLAAKKDLDETTKNDLGIVYREAQRAAKITQNLLSFARRHEPERHPISLNEVIEKTLELRAHQIKVNNIEVVVDFAADLPKTMADFFQMQQVFVNIINNAEQAMIEGHGKGKLVLKTQKVGDMIRISFADDGPGISEENLKRIFDPFFTTKEVGKGTGLGLSICYGLVEAHGGRIYARSKLGQGATFVVDIPIISDGQ